MKIMTQSGDEISIELSDDLVVGEVVKSDEGEMYEVTNMTTEQVTVDLIQVEEDWGE